MIRKAIPALKKHHLQIDRMDVPRKGGSGTSAPLFAATILHFKK